MCYTLSNNYEVTGRSKEGLLAEIADMESKTTYELVQPESIRLYSYKGLVKGKEQDVDTFYTLCKETMAKGIDDLSGRFAPFCTISRVPHSEQINEELLKESLRETGVLLVAPIDGAPTALYVSPEGLAALAEKGGVGGIRVNTPSKFRDVYIMEGILAKSAPLKLVVRTIEENGRTDRKLFGVLTEKYKPISMQLIPETIDAFEEDGSMGKSELRYWKNSQTYTEALVEFPEAAEELAETYGLADALIPGIRISTSDTGDSAVRIQSTFRKDGGRTYVVKKEIKRNHMGKITKEEILKDVKKDIYAEISELPERLAGLMANTIGEPDLTTPAGIEANKVLVQKVVKKAARTLHIGKAIGQKRAKELLEQLACEVDGTLVYTEYDIAMIFIGLGDRVAAIPDNARKMLEKACAEAPYIQYQKGTEPETALLPEEV